MADVLYKLGCQEGDFALGVSKVFLSAGVLARLRQLQQEHMAQKAVVIQAAARLTLRGSRVLMLREERQRQLEEEAAAALAAALAAEEEARRAAAELERAAASELASKQADADGVGGRGHADAAVARARRSPRWSTRAASCCTAAGSATRAGSRSRAGGACSKMELKLGAVAALGGELFVGDGGGGEKAAVEARGRRAGC